MREMEPYCLVLSGGGAKGVYHIGVRRALRELGIPVCAYIGNSIGAIIAAFLAQGLDDKLEEIADRIGVGNIVELPEEMKEGGEIKIDAGSVKGLGTVSRSILAKGGLDTSPWRRLIEEHVDEAVLRAGGKDLGIMTVNLSDLRPREVFLDDMEEGGLVDYLMASSALPGFAMPEIKGKKYLDGGVVDNMPYEMARRRGYRRIIVVDISGTGMNFRPKTEGSETVHIKNSIDMGGVLDFDRDFLDRFQELGYLDAMRAFGKIGGYAYFIKPDEALEREFRAFIAADAARAGAGAPDQRRPAAPRRAAIGPDGPFGPDGAYRTVFPQRMRHDRRVLMKLLDCAASILEPPRVRAWTYGELAAAIAARAAEEEERIALALGGAAGAPGGRAGLEGLFAQAIRTRSFEGCPYYYCRLVREAASKRSLRVLDRILVGIYPELPAGMLYFEAAALFLSKAAGKRGRRASTRAPREPRARA